MIQTISRSREAISHWPVLSIIGPVNSSLMNALFPSMNTTRRVVVSLLFVGLLTAFGRATFYLPDNPVPITFQTTGVLLMGGVLGLRWGLFAIMIYYFLGMAGVGVFKDGANGWDYLTATATGGYIIGFIAAVPLVGYMSERGWHRGRILWPMLLGNMLVYLPGLLWIHYRGLSWWKTGGLFDNAMYPFIPGDLVKLIIASLVVGAGWAVVDFRNRQKQDSNSKI